MKTCTKCGVPKDAFEFGSNGMGGLRGDCRNCNAARTRAYNKSNPVQTKAARQKWRRENPEKHLGYERNRKFGITPGQFLERLSIQGGRCASCGDLFTTPKDTHVDHDHVSKEIRGILCYHCNVGIGLFKDSPMRLLLAIRYLQKTG